jgi:putative ABC transport system permease protein
VNVTATTKVAAKAIWTNKSRSLLTMLGVIIGVGSVILLTSIGTGIQQYIEGQFDDLGANTVSILPMRIFTDDGGFSSQDEQVSAMGNKQLDTRMLSDIKRLDRERIIAVLPELQKTSEVSFQSEKKTTTIIGTSADYERVRNTSAEFGRFFNPAEEDAGERVAVLGFKIAKDLFGTIDPVNKNFRIGSQTFKVVGVAEEKGGTFGGPSFDNYIMIPLEAGFRAFDTRDINAISVQVKSKDQITAVVDELDDYMRNVQKREEDEYDVFDQRQILETINSVLGILTLGLGGIAAISLVVGGIGIMNIMLVSVTERTREIGLRKAVGATPNEILVQFLIEASLLSVFGGAIGVGIAALGSLALNTLADFPSAITPGAILLAFGVSLAVGIVFGVAPARKASRLSPIEALRSE